MSFPSHFDDNSVDHCLICAQSKQFRLLFPHIISKTKSPFDLIHVDVWGPYKHLTHDGLKYF